MLHNATEYAIDVIVCDGVVEERHIVKVMFYLANISHFHRISSDAAGSVAGCCAKGNFNARSGKVAVALVSITRFIVASIAQFGCSSCSLILCL